MTRIKQLLPTYDRHYLIGLFVNKYKIQVETDCWLWQGNKNAKGYGQLRIPTGQGMNIL